MRKLLFMILIASPLPLASARPSWQWLWVVVISLVALVAAAKASRSSSSSKPRPAAWWLMAPVAIVAAWGFLQTLLPGPTLIVTDSGTATAFGSGWISVTPHSTLSVSVILLSHIVLFLLFSLFVPRRDAAAALLRFIGIIGALYAAYGFIIFVSGNETILWFEKWTYETSLTSTFVNRNSYAAYAGLGLQCLLAYAFYFVSTERLDEPETRRHFRQMVELVVTKAWWLLLAVALMAMALMLTNSRGGFGSMLVAIFALILLSQAPGRGGSTLLRKAAMAFGLVAAVALLFELSGTVLEGRLQADAMLDRRFEAYPVIIEAIMDRPWTGYGLGTFEEVFRVYQEPGFGGYFDRGHSDYLEFALTAGIPAALVLVGGLFAIFVYLFRSLKYAGPYRPFIALGMAVMIQLGLHSLVDFSLQIPAVSYTWVAIIAASVTIAERCRRRAASA